MGPKFVLAEDLVDILLAKVQSQAAVYKALFDPIFADLGEILGIDIANGQDNSCGGHVESPAMPVLHS